VSDRTTRILAALGFGVAIVSLTISGWTAMSVARQEEQLRELGESMQERLVPGGGGVEALPMHAPPPTLETEP
jgi:hypothetical protein